MLFWAVNMVVIVLFLIGIGFGFFLERAGFGSARKLMGQFYLTDLAVFKVMFTAIVTAMLGVFYLGWMGILDLSLVYLTPTFLLPEIVGGLVLGVGFVVGGYCPGTACVGIATGRIDALINLAGVIAGIFIFGETFPLLKRFHNTTDMEPLTLPQVLSLPYGLIVFAVVLMAVGAAREPPGSRKHLRPERRDEIMTTPWSKLSRNAKLGFLVCLPGLFAAFAGTPYKGSRVTMDMKELSAIVQREVDHVTPEELADCIIQGKADYRLIDLRSEAEFGQYHIPAAENVPMALLLDHGLARNEKIILYSEGGIHSAQAWFLLRAKDYKAVHMLRDGLDGWKDRILFPSAALGASPDQLAAFEKMKEVSRFFGGTPQAGRAEGNAGPAPALPKLDMPAQPVAGSTAAPKKKKEGC